METAREVPKAGGYAVVLQSLQAALLVSIFGYILLSTYIQPFACERTIKHKQEIRPYLSIDPPSRAKEQA